MGLSPMSNYIEFFFVSCFDIGEVPRSPWKWNWNWLYFLPFIFTFEQGGECQSCPFINFCNCHFNNQNKQTKIYEHTFKK